jgi:hypothetical protein
MASPNISSTNAMDQWARRAVQQTGTLRVRKSRNRGGYQVLDTYKGVINYNLTAEEVIERYGDDVDRLRLRQLSV